MYKSFAVLALTSGLIGGPASAAQVNVTWQDPDSYRDIQPSNQSRQSFRKMIFADFEKYFTKLAEQLPAEQVLTMTVTDLDLAGQVWPSSFLGGMGGTDVRLVKSVYIPRISFSYTLTDGAGNTLQDAQVKLKDMAFMDRGVRTNRRYRNLSYEKAMIKDWFDKTLEQTAAN
ncbi:DUF3016 domain-containing protein [Salinimonas marina]|uniref:DUF3016 domain-containing protein n=1 Tax=Salinimonas marina TaxID=2785918 RepID=A0A7S9DWH1_9ALTE|nr:DUF3016 domain-containing protein [Salinimonas marina]QPG05259.1 DUF3016 domain-containing protein [Salinimonas marina]